MTGVSPGPSASAAATRHARGARRSVVGSVAAVGMAVGMVLGVVLAAVSGAAAQAEVDDGVATAAPADRLTVVTTELAPFVVDDDGRADGFYAEIWDHVADELEVSYDILWVDSFGEVLAALAEGRAEVAVAPLAPTAEREAEFDFSSAVISSGPQLGYHERIGGSTTLVGALLSWSVLRILLVSIAGLTVLAHIIWLVERNQPDDHFHENYPQGVWDGFWWGAVTITTVGYGDKAPQSTAGRVVALLGMLLSLFMVGAFVSQITTILESSLVEPPFRDLATLGDQPVGAVEGSTFAAFLTSEGATVVPYPSQSELFAAVSDGRIDALVTNPFALDALGPRHGVVPTGDVLYEEFETFGLTQGSPWREPVNRALADLQAKGEIAEIVARWSD